MRKTWQRIFLLCMACMICMCGLCFAKKNADWVEFHRESGMIVFLANTDFVKVREWSGRKYLEATILHKMEGGRAEVKYVVVIDVDNHKAIQLEAGQQDISEIANADKMNVRGEKLLRWIEQNRPDVINEIRTNNLTAPPLPSAPRGKTDVTGMEPPVPSTQGGTLANIAEDIPYEVLESGAVKFTLRRGVPSGSNEPTTYYLFTKPEEMKAWPGAYAVGYIYNWQGNNILAIDYLFDYDSATNTIQWYDTASELYGVEYSHDPENAVYSTRMRVMDKNTVYIEEADFMGPSVAEGPFKIMIDSYFGKKYPVQYTIKYLSCADPEHRDVNGCAWSFTDYGGERMFSHGERFETAILCCSLKGNLGEIPIGDGFESFDYQSNPKYQFSR